MKACALRTFPEFPFILAVFQLAATWMACGQVTFSWQTIGDVGNPSMVTRPSDAVNVAVTVGSMDHEYAISKYEVSNAQYVAFLNAVASQGDPHGLYNPSAEIHELGGIVRFGTGPFTYASKQGREDYPVNFVGAFDAARFVNWLHNGQGQADTEDGVYDMLEEHLLRKAGARVFLPSENEWHKAAYYDPRSTSEGGPSNDDHYWLYPSQSESIPNKAVIDGAGNITNPQPNLANWGRSNPYGLCKVHTGGPGTETYYGVMHMGGNVVEWIEDRNSQDPSRYDIRGGDWENGDWDQRNDFINSTSPSHESTYLGIRLAATLAYAGGGIDAAGNPIQPGPIVPDPIDPDPGNPDPGNPDPGNPDPGNPDPGNPDPGNPDPVDPVIPDPVAPERPS